MGKLRGKWHGVPVWAWLVVLAAMVAFVIWRRRQAAKAQQPDPNSVQDGGDLAGVPSIGLQDPSIDQPQYGRDAIPPPPGPSVIQTFNFPGQKKKKLPPGEGNKGGKGGKKHFTDGPHWVRDDNAPTHGGHGRGRGRSGGGAAPYPNPPKPGDDPGPLGSHGGVAGTFGYPPHPAGWHPTTGPVPHIGFGSNAAHQTAGGTSHSAMATGEAGGPPDRPHPELAHGIIRPGEAKVIGGPVPNLGPPVASGPGRTAIPLTPFPGRPVPARPGRLPNPPVTPTHPAPHDSPRGNGRLKSFNPGGRIRRKVTNR
jgi:hypothetical protein